MYGILYEEIVSWSSYNVGRQINIEYVALGHLSMIHMNNEIWSMYF
jgi:hypothetical protein